MSASHPMMYQLLIDGYIHKTEHELDIFIPPDLYAIILSFYPFLIKFELYSTTRFEILNDGYEIKGLGGCDGYTIYPQALEPNGFTKGIHIWSVLLIGVKNKPMGYCFHNVGVVSNKRDTKWVDTFTDNWPYLDEDNKNKTSWYKGNDYNGENNYWESNQIMTVKLDCDMGTVQYFKNDKAMKMDTIDNNQSYFFGLNSCASADNWFKVVHPPLTVGVNQTSNNVH